MRTSQFTGLSEPEGDEKISAGTLAYISTRVQLWAYNLVVKEFKNSGITQAQLARRLGKGQDLVSRMLSRPGNWELKTFSEFLFAISGAVLKFSIERPLANAAQNATFYKVKSVSTARPASTASVETVMQQSEFHIIKQSTDSTDKVAAAA
jgi:hypothetical protein